MALSGEERGPGGEPNAAALQRLPAQGEHEGARVAGKVAEADMLG